MSIDGWLLVLIAVLFALDAYYTRKWLSRTKRELREIQREIRRDSARALGVRDDDD
jgi:HAMP domain-containing protein